MVDVEVERLEVGAGAEGLAAGAGEDEDARAGVRLEVVESAPKELGGRAIDGVAPLGAIDRQHRRGADPLVVNALGHGQKSRERAG